MRIALSAVCPYLAFALLLLENAHADLALTYSTYLGGAGYDDVVSGIAVDRFGNAYVSGVTESPDFPITTGVDRTMTGGHASFVAKFSPSGTLLYSTFIPGSCGGSVNAITVDAEGNAYVTGSAGICGNLLLRGVLVAKLDPNGALVYFYSFGTGEKGDMSEGTAIAIDAAGNAYVVGSADFNFPTTPGAFQPTGCGGFLTDGFIAKVNPAGDGLVYSTYLCGNEVDALNAIAVDKDGNAYVAGGTLSHDFPVVNAYQTNHPGDVFTSAGFLCKLNPGGTQLDYSTYFTGSFGDTKINAMTLDAQGNPYVTGGSTGGKLPTTPGVVQPTSPFPSCWGGICSDAFIAKFSPAGSLIFSTWLAGEQEDSGEGIVLDAAGNIYVTGATGSFNFPVLNAFQREPQGVFDVFVTKLNRDASRILLSSYLGGKKVDNSATSPAAKNDPGGIAIDSAGNIYLAGTTTSLHFPTTPGAFQRQSGGGFCFLSLLVCDDAFVASLTPKGPAIVPAISLNVTPQEALPGETITATWAGIPTPGTDDRIYLFQLGDAGHGPFILATFPTTGAAEGTVPIALPATLAPGTYELRLYTIDPDRAPLLKPVARSEPVYITGGLAPAPTLVAALEQDKVFHLAIAGFAPGTYQVEATEALDTRDWQVVSLVTVSETGSADFTEPINQIQSARFYRVVK